MIALGVCLPLNEIIFSLCTVSNDSTLYYHSLIQGRGCDRTGMTKTEREILESSPGQLDKTIRRTRDGWGIGLATMKMFVDFLGGGIDVESRRGFGTNLTINIPVKCGEKEVEYGGYRA